MERPHTPTPPMHCLTQGRSHVINVSAFELSETALYRSLLEESSKKCFSRFAFRGLARGQHDNAFSQLQIADQADTLAGGFPKMPSTRLLNQWTHRFNPLLGATWLGQRDEYWVIDQAPKVTPRGGIFRGSQRHSASPSVP